MQELILYLSVLAFLINPSKNFHVISYKYMCYTRYHLSSILNSVCQYHIVIFHVFQLSITYQHGLILYSAQTILLYLGIWYSYYPYLSLILFHNYYTLYILFSLYFFISSYPIIYQYLILNIEKRD